VCQLPTIQSCTCRAGRNQSCLFVSEHVTRAECLCDVVPWGPDFLLFSFFSVFHFLVVGSVFVSFRAHVKVTCCIVSYRMTRVSLMYCTEPATKMWKNRTITEHFAKNYTLAGPGLSVWRPWAGSLLDAPTHPQML